MLNGECKADLPLRALSGNAPEYDRPWVETPAAADMDDVPEVDPIDALKALISSVNYASKQWVYEQYDSQVMATHGTPWFGAGVIRVHGTEKNWHSHRMLRPAMCVQTQKWGASSGGRGLSQSDFCWCASIGQHGQHEFRQS